MSILSTHEEIVWWEFHHGMATSKIAEEFEKERDAPQDQVEFYKEYMSTTENRIVTITKELTEVDEARTEKVLREQLDQLVETRQSMEKRITQLDERFVFNDSAYISRVLNRARKKISKALRDQANSHRLDIESVLDYNGILIGFDYQANAQVYIIFSLTLGIIVWYKHDSYAGKLCPECPKESECRETLNTIMKEYNFTLRPDEEQLHMTQQSIAIFNKLAAKEVPRYKRKESK